MTQHTLLSEARRLAILASLRATQADGTTSMGIATAPGRRDGFDGRVTIDVLIAAFEALQPAQAS